MGIAGHLIAPLLLATTQLMTPAHAYEIRPRQGIHEAITVAALDCLAISSDQQPQDCDRYASHLAYLSEDPLGYSYGELEQAVRWPDDPTRQIRPATLIKFGFNASLNCPRYLRRSPELGNAGLLCSSHYGDLQFFHAMVSQTGETAQQTRAKILDWARFTFEVATGRIDPTMDYCEYFRSPSSSIADSMAPASFPFCRSEARPNGWRISTLFSLQCRNPISSQTCTEVTGLSASTLSRRTALGALLHLIQDSFSQSHVMRGTREGATYMALVECSLPSRFYDYRAQNASHHRVANDIPQFGTSCATSAEADDVITASAMTLWYVRERSEPAEFVRYLERRVVGSNRITARD